MKFELRNWQTHNTILFSLLARGINTTMERRKEKKRGY
jgi:hypothetical protein